MASKDFIFWLADELRRFVQPLEVGLSSKEDFVKLLERYGWLLEPDVFNIRDIQNVLALIDDIAAAASLISEILGPATNEPPLETYAELLALFTGMAGKIRQLPTLPPPPGFSAELWTSFSQELLDGLVADYLEAYQPLAMALLLLFGVIEEEALDFNGVVGRTAYTRRRMQWSRLGQAVTQPDALMRELYGWNDPDEPLRFELLLNRLKGVFGLLGLPTALVAPSEELVNIYYSPTNTHRPRVQELRIMLIGGEDENSNIFAYALTLLPIPPVGDPAGAPAGLVISSMFTAGTPPAGLLWPFTLEFSGLFQSTGQARLEVEPGKITPVLDDPPAAAVDAEVALIFESINTQVLLGTRFSHRLQLFGWEVRLHIAGALDDPEAALEVALNHLQLVLDFSAADGFLRNTFGTETQTFDFDVSLLWSSKTGLHFRGRAGLELVVPINRSISVVEVQSLTLGLRTQDSNLELVTGVTGNARIGPILVSVDNVGVRLLLRPVAAEQPAGVLGDLDLSFDFKPPDGVGLAIDGSVVGGGGYLRFDPQKEEYSGMLELQIAERIAVKAIGLLTTRMPDGAKGYSLLILITAEGFAPIPLGLGFTLTGVGGLLAINRTFAEDALRAGLKNHTLDSVLFPQDPIRNVPQILSNLNSVFPPANGHHLFGPMVQLAWGTPPLFTAELGLVLEFGARRRLLILGQVVAILPRRDHELLRLQLDAIGVLDFDQGTVALDATLYDSRLLKRFTLTGDMALRMQWQGSRTFALAVGGLHPAFHPPPNFPKLARLALDLSRGDNPRLRCEAYFALTSNTVQFGARAELYAAAIGFSIHGDIGFDVLIERDPFHFLADFYAQVQLKRGSTNLFKVRVEGTLEGPRPLHIKGKATFEILWWDVTVRFNVTLVGGVTLPLAELIDVLPLLSAALVHPGNWRSQLPAGQRPMVTLRATPGAATDVCLHPLGTLTVTQSVVPLNLEISRFGSAVPAGARSFTISSVSLGSLGGQHQTPPSVTDFFAPAQFFEMSDAEKLSRPSFEPMAAGFSIGAEAFVFSEDPDDWLEVATIAYDTITVDTQTNELRRRGPNEPYALSPGLLGKQARFGAAGSSELRRTGSAKYRTTRGGTYELVPEGWIIVPTEDLPARPAPGSAAGTLMTYSEAVQALRQLQQEDPAKAAGLTILRLSELPSSE